MIAPFAQQSGGGSNPLKIGIVLAVFVGAIGYLGYILLADDEQVDSVVVAEGETERTLKCEACGETFTMTIDDYKTAMANRPEGGKIVCPKCGEAKAWNAGGSGPGSKFLNASPEQIQNAVPMDDPSVAPRPVAGTGRVKKQ